MHRNDLDKACFQRDIACGEYKDLQVIQKYDRYQRKLASMVYNGFLITSLLRVVVLKICQISNLQMNS